MMAGYSIIIHHVCLLLCLATIGDANTFEKCGSSPNKYRAYHIDTPALEWDATLSTKAQAYAEVLLRKALANGGEISNEDWAHDPNNSNDGTGENLYTSNGKKGDIEFFCADADKLWYDEIKNYDFTTGKAKSNGVIGHFTQMVWASSTKVGYGVAVADSPKYKHFGGKLVFVVAKYKPGGNSGDYRKNVKSLKQSTADANVLGVSACLLVLTFVVTFIANQ